MAIEKRRWNRRGRGRLPVDERLCSCGLVQTEVHIIEECPISVHVRQLHNITSINELMSRPDYDSVCRIVHRFLTLY